MPERSLAVRLPSKRFDVQRTLGGWEVIDTRDGRPVSESLPSDKADTLRSSLNLAAYSGRELLYDLLTGSYPVIAI